MIICTQQHAAHPVTFLLLCAFFILLLPLLSVLLLKEKVPLQKKADADAKKLLLAQEQNDRRGRSSGCAERCEMKRGPIAAPPCKRPSSVRIPDGRLSYDGLAGEARPPVPPTVFKFYYC